MAFSDVLGGLASRLRNAAGVDANWRPLPVEGKNVETRQIRDESSDPYIAGLTAIKHTRKPEDPACV